MTPPMSAPSLSDEKFCLFCNKLGHFTSECHSTAGLNTPQARELMRLANIASDRTLRAGQSEPVTPPPLSGKIKGALIRYRKANWGDGPEYKELIELLEADRAALAYINPFGSTDSTPETS